MSNLEQYNKLRAEFEAAREIIPSRWSNYQAHITVLLLLVSMYQIALSIYSLGTNQQASYRFQRRWSTGRAAQSATFPVLWLHRGQLRWAPSTPVTFLAYTFEMAVTRAVI